LLVATTAHGPNFLSAKYVLSWRDGNRAKVRVERLVVIRVPNIDAAPITAPPAPAPVGKLNIPIGYRYDFTASSEFEIQGIVVLGSEWTVFRAEALMEPGLRL